MPKVTSKGRSKPWWISELKGPGKNLAKAQLQAQSKPNSNILKDADRRARNEGFQAIQDAKKNHGNEFLEQEDTQTIINTMASTKELHMQRMPDLQMESSFEGLEI
ncbi:hypothetical protein DSL72_007565 [Monilinia vaccinii-corymbosi]|uniref:Uncharacterized protein n=1 Tax=Monilinia vaccinii-corymbosi TaxID=61207 RepID=A0A8A3PI07_9HELO|nr:hypothetical protein DSL72_007565 [Monilinia vaccinii-corymbosi]